MVCHAPHCSNDVPPGWDGGYCAACCRAIEESENERAAARLAEETSELARLEAEVVEAAAVDPLRLDREDYYERYGFDYPWESNR